MTKTDTGPEIRVSANAGFANVGRFATRIGLDSIAATTHEPALREGPISLQNARILFGRHIGKIDGAFALAGIVAAIATFQLARRPGSAH